MSKSGRFAVQGFMNAVGATVSQTGTATKVGGNVLARFTLIELLVVVAIIAILAALLLLPFPAPSTEPRRRAA